MSVTHVLPLHVQYKSLWHIVPLLLVWISLTGLKFNLWNTPSNLFYLFCPLDWKICSPAPVFSLLLSLLCPLLSFLLLFAWLFSQRVRRRVTADGKHCTDERGSSPCHWYYIKSYQTVVSHLPITLAGACHSAFIWIS